MILAAMAFVLAQAAPVTITLDPDTSAAIRADYDKVQADIQRTLDDLDFADAQAEKRERECIADRQIPGPPCPHAEPAKRPKLWPSVGEYARVRFDDALGHRLATEYKARIEKETLARCEAFKSALYESGMTKGDFLKKLGEAPGYEPCPAKK
jgi:hypothetical protein